MDDPKADTLLDMLILNAAAHCLSDGDAVNISAHVFMPSLQGLVLRPKEVADEIAAPAVPVQLLNSPAFGLRRIGRYLAPLEAQVAKDGVHELFVVLGRFDLVVREVSLVEVVDLLADCSHCGFPRVQVFPLEAWHCNVRSEQGVRQVSGTSAAHSLQERFSR